jgi:hypothetical protein
MSRLHACRCSSRVTAFQFSRGSFPEFSKAYEFQEDFQCIYAQLLRTYMSNNGESHFDGTEPYRSHGARLPVLDTGSYVRARCVRRSVHSRESTRAEGHTVYSNSHLYHIFYTCNTQQNQIAYQLQGYIHTNKRKEEKRKQMKGKRRRAHELC